LSIAITIWTGTGITGKTGREDITDEKKNTIPHFCRDWRSR
jgi:hypothetical protein